MDTLLVVEDDSIVRQMLAEVLEDEGYQVLCAMNGLEALKLLRTADMLPRVILLDVRMPLMDGWQFLETIQQDPGLGQLPVIIISAGYQLERKIDMQQSISLVQKPIDLDTLIATVETYCAPHHT